MAKGAEQSIQLENGIEVEIRRNVRSRKLSLKVSYDGKVWINAPLHAPSYQAILLFVLKHQAFIQSSLQKFRHRQQHQSTASRARPNLPFPLYSAVPSEGILLPLQAIVKTDTSSLTVLHTPKAVEVHLPKQDREYTPQELQHKAYAAWHQQTRIMARRMLPEITLATAVQHNFSPKVVKVNSPKKRWGSCSSSGSININWRAWLLPASVRLYLLLHELTHLHHPNHSKDFWQGVQKVYPAYKQAEQWLQQNEEWIFFYTPDALLA